MTIDTIINMHLTCIFKKPKNASYIDAKSNPSKNFT